MTRTAPVADWRRPLTIAEKRGLVVEILRTYAQARLAMRSNKLIDLASRARSSPATTENSVPPSDHRPAALHLASAVNRVVGRLPTDSRCLARSLVLTSLLARRGIGSSLVIGVRSEPTFVAHAWVEMDGRALLPPGDELMQRLIEV